MSVPSFRVHTNAVIAALEGFGLEVGDGVAPKGNPDKYGVVHRISAELSGTLDAPDVDAEIVYQVTCVGKKREQAEWVADQAMGLLNGIIVAGRAIARVSLDELMGTTESTQRDDDVTPPIFYSVLRFKVKSTP